MEKSNIKSWVLTIIAIIAVALFVVLFISGNKQTINSVTSTTGTSSTVEPDSTQDISSQSTGAGSVSISYANALVKYATKRIQLNKICQATPNNVTYKDNTGIMIDNRSAQTRTIKVGTTFTIKPWGFKIVVLPDVYLKAKTILVDCDSYQNVATILVQE